MSKFNIVVYGDSNTYGYDPLNGRYDAFVERVREEKKKYVWSHLTEAILKLL